MKKPTVIPLKEIHWPHVARSYQAGLDTDMASFETQTPSWSQWHVSHHTFARLVCTVNEVIVGWAALSPVSTRKVYAGVAELSMYCDLSYTGQGIGSLLMEKVLIEAEAHGIWTVQSSLFPENEASLALHKKYGFRVVGTRKRISQRLGRWRDTLLMEWRSTKKD